jgi:hypothetical protein
MRNSVHRDNDELTLALLETLKTARKKCSRLFYLSLTKTILSEKRPSFRALAEFLACPLILFLGFLQIGKTIRRFMQ